MLISAFPVFVQHNPSNNAGSIGRDRGDAYNLQPVGFLRVEVVDNGAGIALQDQARVFKEFSQFNRNKLQGGGMKGCGNSLSAKNRQSLAIGGSGLGLWISKRIIDMHEVRHLLTYSQPPPSLICGAESPGIVGTLL